VILGHFGALPLAIGGLAVLMLSVEAFARGHLWQFVAGLVVAAVAGTAAWLAAQAVIGNWRLAVAVLLILAAVALLLANVRDFFRKRLARWLRSEIPYRGPRSWASPPGGRTVTGVAS
jgi:hypothetical protein